MNYTQEYLSGLDLFQLQHLDIKNKQDEEMVQAVLTIKRTHIPAPRATGSHRFVDTDLIAKGVMSEAEAQRIVDEKTIEEQLKFASSETVDREEQEVTEPEEKKEEPVAAFCAFCTSKGVRHKNECTRPQNE